MLLKAAIDFPKVKTRYMAPAREPGHIRNGPRAMTVLVKGKKHFRWHDSGDLQGVWHLKNIFEVCNNTPATMHWLPTQERQYLPLGSYPANLVIRLSNAKNNTATRQRLDPLVNRCRHRRHMPCFETGQRVWEL